MMPESSSEISGPVQSIRRSVTLPTKLNPQAQRGTAPINLSENVIFYHPSAKIVHFAPRALVPIPSSSAPSDFDYPVDTIETLPWRSATERTVATAPLRLEKVHGLTVFLKCGNVVHAILKNSQCWCVDGVSKFVLRIRPLTYYRIEIPHDSEENKSLVEDLKVALPTVLRYEVTPCPFKRTFTVELPEDAMAPRRKKAWRPKERKDSLTPISGLSSEINSEWIDSASTGEDTDGAGTDDSGLTPQVTNSTTSEALPVGDQSTLAPSAEPSREPVPARRSVTDTPQTFTSLLAKFDAAPVIGDVPGPMNPSTVENSASKGQRGAETCTLSSAEHEAVDDDHSIEDASNPLVDASETILQSKELPVLQEALESEDNRTCDDASKPEEDLVSARVAAVENKLTLSALEVAENLREPLLPDAGVETLGQQDQNDYAVLRETQIPLKPSLHAEAVCSKNRSVPDDDRREILTPNVNFDPGSDFESDHDISFSSSPESFHSADLGSSADTHSANTSPIALHEIATEMKPSNDPGAGRIMSSTTPSISHLAGDSPPSTIDIPSTQGSSENYDTSSGSIIMPKYIVREDPPKKPSLSIPSDRSKISRPAPKAASPTTDFKHMSTEFRRRAQATTRQRDISPMPPASAIYQPSSSEPAGSLLSKALALVLVPPIHLFIILLHVAARIVISPALNTTLGEPVMAQPSSTEASTEDDFSFPLEREASSEYEEAHTGRKLDPWDLD
ncbi:hypothetical protein N7462_001845 [Penicillium macrosclerotiorum]|uniref:uncharacterized protein n=1 Tax=Penicillium macrosclerotiorum TaxID=303699 RepID=UPI0025471F67|nr:uncharacterized protein N7462_001845 [Penicillium macrosclerotiorum]KAJ5692422.1 hypothetical protein N7462_001845 [Penicillium macrosclerotiorum]